MRTAWIFCSFGLALVTGLYVEQQIARAEPAANPACFKACDQAGLSVDDRATCQIQCEGAAQLAANANPPTTTSPAAATTRIAVNCASQCASQATPADRATCQLMCEQNAVQSTSTPAVSPAAPPAPTPSAAAECFTSCNQQKLSPTDLETCRLTCSLIEEVRQENYLQYPQTGAPGASYEQTRQQVIHSSPGVVSPATPGQPSPPGAVQQSGGVAPPSAPLSVCMQNWQRCGQQCSVPLTACYSECEAPGVRKTDQETCRLTCEVATNACQDQCNLQRANCEQQPRNPMPITPQPPAN